MPVPVPASASAPEPPLPGERELISDGGFEGPAPGAWTENNWARNEVGFSRDHERPYRGQACQRISLIRVLHEPNLQFVHNLAGVKAGDAVRVRLAARGLANARPLEVMIRKSGPPYTDFGHLRMPITEDWQPASFVAVMPASLPADVGLYLSLADVNTVWVDEVSVTVLPPVDLRPAPAGNLIANGSFEIGTSGWYANLQGSVAPLAADFAAPTVGDAPDGRHALRVQAREEPAQVNSAWFAYRYGQPLRLSCDLKTETPTDIEVGLGQGEAPNVTWALQRQVHTGPAWQHCEFTCTPGASATNRLFLQFTCRAGETVWIDRVAVEQAPGPPAREVGCALRDPPPGAIYRPDEQPHLVVRAVHGVPGTTLAAIATVSDAWAATTRLPLTLAIAADGSGSAELDLPTARFGGFRVAIETAGHLAAEQIYCVVPALPPPDGSGRSFFGGHFMFTDYGLAVAERGGFRWLRLHPPLFTKWHLVEPKPGAWHLPTAEIERATSRGFSVCGSLDSPPEWAATPGINLPYVWWNCRVPRDWGEWSAYVQKVVTGLPQIRAWEVYNEPDCDFLVVKPGEDKPAAYAEILAHTREAVEASGAKVTLVGLPVSSLDHPFFRDVLAKGGAGSVDALAFHFYYEDLDPLEKVPSFLDQLASMRAARSRSGGEPEIWHTEGGMWLAHAPSWYALSGIAGTEGTGQLEAAHALVRTAVALKALGVKHHFQYAGLGSPAGRLVYRSECAGLFDVDGSARPALAAHAAMVWLLDDAAPAGVETVMAGEATVRLARFSSTRLGAITVAWSRQPIVAAQVHGLLDGVREIRDLMGNPLTGMPTLGPAPIYVIAQPRRAP